MGCKKWGLKGCLLSFSGNRPKSAFLACFLFCSPLFRRPQKPPGQIRKRKKKAFFLRYPLICLNPHLFYPHWRLDTGFWYNFCADFGAQIYAQIFCAYFCAQIFAQIFGAHCLMRRFFRRFLRRFSADFS